MQDLYLIAVAVSAIALLMFVFQAFMSLKTTDKAIVVSSYVGLLLLASGHVSGLIIIVLIITIYVLHSLFTGEWE